MEKRFVATISSILNDIMSKTLQMLDGYQHPIIGLGTYLLKDPDAISTAIKSGYRCLDTACYYHNHREFGLGVKKSGVPRSELFLTSKVDPWTGAVHNARQSILRALNEAQLEYWDLVLIHSPSGGKNTRLNAYEELSSLVDEGKIRSLGVSNYGAGHIEELLASKPKYGPVVNQVEVHTMHSNDKVVRYCQEKGIIVEGYCPLGRKQFFNNRALIEIAKKYNCSVPQLMLSWLIGRGIVPLPKSSDDARQRENLESTNVTLREADMTEINKLDEQMDVDGQYIIQDGV
ncbi:Aldo/keto reductase [Wallemia mellicola]|uniref:Aldo/keto reductase n=1 Tax=Wallemia mellicola TaxID=1708541 RepID=A0A4T0P358_9BASI|nr:Aldo/keto reductase [Wallemia mellicola]TIC04512.1 Aldo/keto reductase [Wallemia mellicola]TIC20358.1 Aldo/keto reductase [Wallemia mellicola]